MSRTTRVSASDRVPRVASATIVDPSTSAGNSLLQSAPEWVYYLMLPLAFVLAAVLVVWMMIWALVYEVRVQVREWRTGSR
jgi:hypothetical protein